LIVRLTSEFPEFVLIWVWMAYPVRADAFKDTAIVPPLQGEPSHVMIGWVMNDAYPTNTVITVMQVCQSCQDLKLLSRADSHVT
jgi:hypothetical protein